MLLQDKFLVELVFVGINLLVFKSLFINLMKASLVYDRFVRT